MIISLIRYMLRQRDLKRVVDMEDRKIKRIVDIDVNNANEHRARVIGHWFVEDIGTYKKISLLVPYHIYKKLTAKKKEAPKEKTIFRKINICLKSKEKSTSSKK